MPPPDDVGVQVAESVSVSSMSTEELDCVLAKNFLAAIPTRVGVPGVGEFDLEFDLESERDKGEDLSGLFLSMFRFDSDMA